MAAEAIAAVVCVKRGSGERGTRLHRALPWSRETSDVVRATVLVNQIISKEERDAEGLSDRISLSRARAFSASLAHAHTHAQTFSLKLSLFPTLFIE